ncbi:hypothetical protein LOTGIDRAFT_238275 [Lottia gigantea]|uniref:Uncharacterized protein n=1 Tax=Lottia gigantea TaxID=225164 RepID=V4AVX0_LOTGI|nr:hypothetical protein LOTGIDRAFT_238275 [Lottia gigantea]ESP01548.1 hypothetical protein LOTGIDRAFT_238275 [Lottia gigantea]
MAGQMKELAATAIGQAIKLGNIRQLKTLFKIKDAPFFIDRYGNTALHVSVLQNECWHVSELMAWGINPYIKNSEGKTAAELPHKNKYWNTIYEKYLPGIFEAVEKRDGDKIRELISYWTKVDCTRNGQTLRQFAAQLKYHDIVQIIDEYKDTLDLIYGVFELNYDKVHDALNKSRCNVNFLNKTGCNIRDVARLARRKDIVEFIDKYYIKLIRDSELSQLRRLLIDGYDSLLIQHNYRDSFIYASGNETNQVLQFIEDLPNIQSQIEKVHKCIKLSGNMVEFEELFQTSPGILMYLINAKDKGGRSAVKLAVLHKRLDILRYLLDQPDVDVNSQDNCRRTAYHYACCTEIHIRDDFIVLLKEKGIDTDIADHLGYRGDHYLKEDMREWIIEKRKYEDLRSIIKHKNYGLTELNIKLKTLHVPVAAFSMF